MDPAVATEPIPKKRGRPRKVVSEDAAAAAEPKTAVRKASTKTVAAEKKAEAPKKAARATKATTTTKTTTKTATKSTTKAAANKAAKATEAAVASKSTASTNAASAPVVDDVETAKVDVKPTPVTPSTSKILEEVYKTGTVKPPPQEPVVEEVVLPTGGAANVVLEQPMPTATKPSLSQTTPKPTYTPPTSSARTPTTPPPARPLAPKSKATTIPLPVNPSKPATPRPKALSPEELEKAEVERHIREGRMPPKYRPAARRVTSIIVGIPFIIVVGYELYKRWDAEIRTKFDADEKRTAA